ncbi:DNA cytosine methyltransferase [Rhizobium brockwellii]|uniref:DNA cytosine methyltransferase n=1 Tax=Rhizobium brockwellii TaxID=3019932 RepID=UPI003F9A5102
MFQLNFYDSSRSTNNTQRRMLSIDLFAGAGGFSLGAQNAGFAVKLAIELNKHACATYRHNLSSAAGGPEIIEGDITKLSADELKNEIFGDLESCDLLLGGPPCQGFSTHRLNDAGVDDPRNNLLHTYFEFVRTFAPKAFLMENVPGMLWPRHASYVESFYKNAREIGYEVYPPAVLDARDYGVWQRRKRVFVLGIRRDLDRTELNWPPKATHVDPQFESPDPHLLPWVPCLGAFSPAPRDDPNDIHMQHSASLIDVFARTPHNGGSRKDSGRILPCHLGHDGHGDVYGRIDPRMPAPTMTTACINPSKGRFVHPTNDHGITLRQAARIQTFPDSYVFTGGLMAAGQQIGNAVPVQLAEKLLLHLRAWLADQAMRVDVPLLEDSSW